MKDEEVSRSHGPPWERTGGMPTPADGMTIFKYHRIESKKNSMAIVFLRWAIQATDSTFTGCTAKMTAAKKRRGWTTAAG